MFVSLEIQYDRDNKHADTLFMRPTYRPIATASSLAGRGNMQWEEGICETGKRSGCKMPLSLGELVSISATCLAPVMTSRSGRNTRCD